MITVDGAYYFGCPQCGVDLFCGCKSCADRHADRIKMRFTDDGEHEACGNCGYTMHADYWLDEEANQMTAAGLWPTDRDVA